MNYLWPFVCGFLGGAVVAIFNLRQTRRARRVVEWLYCGIELDSPGWWVEMRKRTWAFDGKDRR